MQLNNKINGESIKIDKIDILQNRVVYSLYGLDGIISQTVKTFEQITLKDYLNQTVNFTELCYTQVKLELNLIDYTLESDTQCWLSPYKTKRFTIPNSLIVTAIKEDNEFKVAIDKIVSDSKIDTEILIIETSNNTIVYANSINSSIEDVIMQYISVGIISVEEKL